MKLFNPKNYPDLLEMIPLTSEEIKTIISNYTLSFPVEKHPDVEWHIEFPVFAVTFYKEIIQNHRIPTQEHFFENYVADHADFFREKRFGRDILLGLKARVFRTYPSLVRDLFFNKFVKEQLTGASVIYNITLDIKEGIDLLISIHHNFHYAVNLFTDTYRARVGRDKKQRRHDPFQNVVYIDLPIHFNGSLKCGAFFLFEKRELQTLLKLTVDRDYFPTYL
ncbi:MAG: hypothetical protein FWF54_09080 [Candidatus Azobacteroides sp.]|nr:hypothetical protein [Candidatus Azobacteroides sp.]